MNKEVRYERIFRNKTVKNILYAVLSFVLSVSIVGVALSSLLRFTVLNNSFLTDALNNSNYYTDLCDEITDDLMDIGDASGLDKSFFEALSTRCSFARTFRITSTNSTPATSSRLTRVTLTKA